jgi:hypothetical protein
VLPLLVFAQGVCRNLLLLALRLEDFFHKADLIRLYFVQQLAVAPQTDLPLPVRFDGTFGAEIAGIVPDEIFLHQSILERYR